MNNTVGIGIDNVNNNCYASAVLQCLKRVGIDLINRLDMYGLSGNFEDASEFYMAIMGILSSLYRNTDTDGGVRSGR